MIEPNETNDLKGDPSNDVPNPPAPDDAQAPDTTPAAKSKDPLASAYGRVRDATKNNSAINPAEALAVLEQVKFEILRDNQGVIDVSILQDQIDAGATVG